MQVIPIGSSIDSVISVRCTVSGSNAADLETQAVAALGRLCGDTHSIIDYLMAVSPQVENASGGVHLWTADIDATIRADRRQL